MVEEEEPKEPTKNQQREKIRLSMMRNLLKDLKLNFKQKWRKKIGLQDKEKKKITL
ncbi:hypothetical protein Tco_1024590, partial [Tanacetum coccineum]